MLIEGQWFKEQVKGWSPTFKNFSITAMHHLTAMTSGVG